MSTNTSPQHPPVISEGDPGGLHRLRQRFARVRQLSCRIAEPLSAEDCAMQTMPDVSPTRWHLAHTTWFFETFVLKAQPDYQAFHAGFELLFNSYYNSVGEQFPRHRRGTLSRPSLQEVFDYRVYVDRQIDEILAAGSVPVEMQQVLELGLNHEQQHQELMLTDIKHVLSCHPLRPAYQQSLGVGEELQPGFAELQWLQHPEQLVHVGFDGDGFAFDNERPRHRAFLHEFAIASRCVTNAEYLRFVEDRGYGRPEFWLSMGWAQVQQGQWTMPLYWEQRDGQWYEFTLAGLRPLAMDAPVCHVSYFEADAFARWCGCRLPTEFEWEQAAAEQVASEQSGKVASPAAGIADDLLGREPSLHPSGEQSDRPPMLGNLWQWTASQYMPYPGFQAAAGALGEYNGKFMCNQFVLRGGSCATPAEHIRLSYRNFFPPDARWQFAGFRLAK